MHYLVVVVIDGLHHLSLFIHGSDIYLGINTILDKKVAIKLESVKAKHPQLELNRRVPRNSPVVSVDNLFVCDYNTMIINLLGLSLHGLLDFCNQKFSLKTDL